MNKYDNTISLSDGRSLGYNYYGPKDGQMLICFHGYPGNRTDFLGYERYANKYNIRIVALDRPGFGLSDYKENRTLLDIANDVSELADYLNADRFSLLGISGGGPYAIACAYALSDRVECCVSISGLTPLHESTSFMQNMTASNKITFTLADKHPSIIENSFKVADYVIRKFPKFYLAMFKRQMPKSDRETMGKYNENQIKSFQQRSEDLYHKREKALLKEAQIYTKAWNLDYKKITTSVHLWHGIEDKNVPVAGVKWLEKQIPNCNAHYCQGEGHMLFQRHIDEIMNTVASYRTQDDEIIDENIDEVIYFSE